MIRDVIQLQKTEELERILNERYVERDTKPFSMEHNLIKVIMGPRRAGKSFFAVHALKQNGVAFGYANFDNEELVGSKSYDDIIAEINAVYGSPKILFLDEVQNLPKWELFANRLQRQGYNLVVSGSNSNILSGDLATHLTGRHLPTTVFTFSFSEYVRAKVKQPDLLTSSQKKELLSSYLQDGGYPEPLTKALNPVEYLNVLFDSIIYKDVIKKHGIRKGRDVEMLATYLMSTTASEFSYLSLTKTVGIKSDVTIQKYLGYLEEAYLFFAVERFSYKIKRSMQSRKIYCYDNGMISAKALKTSKDMGRLLENAVAISLKRRESKDSSTGLYYWKGQHNEVDFAIKKAFKITQLIQVCFDVSDPKTKDREVRALINASAETKCKDLLVLTYDYEAAEKHEWFDTKAEVRFVPAWKWLLGESGE